ncbi:hypothetical protein FB45DRAFT_891471 [Roridomyces roridus]|uniref:Uncharacterized protein n=1 Tax=Roridomyces roridus TaxID=1738132 RepID=A0AAD7CE59_9AGAR|nr:hypothetical protein FB45DRAFT_891471 [Roridomyces roridus]
MLQRLYERVTNFVARSKTVSAALSDLYEAANAGKERTISLSETARLRDTKKRIAEKALLANDSASLQISHLSMEDSDPQTLQTVVTVRSSMATASPQAPPTVVAPTYPPPVATVASAASQSELQNPFENRDAFISLSSLPYSASACSLVSELSTYSESSILTLQVPMSTE